MASRVEEDTFNNEMLQLAWQTALLMNATGNYKKRIKPSDLFNPIETGIDSEEDQPDEKTKEQLQKELLEVFTGSDVD